MRRLASSLFVVPIMTVLAFAVLAGMSFVEIRGSRKEPAAPEEPASPAVLERYRAESRKLRQIREEARSEVTTASLVSVFAEKKPDEVPETRTLLAWLRTLVRRDGRTAADTVLLALLPTWETLREAQKEDRRRAALEEVLIQASLTASDSVVLSDADRERIFTIMEDQTGQRKGLARALLTLLARTARPGDLERLRTLRECVASRQFRQQIETVVAELERREFSRADE